MKLKLMMTLAAIWLITTALSATEQLNRALVAFNTSDNTTFVSWRFFDGEQDYNIFITEVKTLLFGEDNYRDDFTMSMAGYALLITLLIMILIAAAGFVVTVIKAKKSEDIWGDISMILLAVTQVGSIITFSLKYPHICSMNFRYSTPLILCGILFYTKISDIKLKGANKDLVTKITRTVAVAFMVFAIVFYTILWTYVKGEVAVVDVTW